MTARVHTPDGDVLYFEYRIAYGEAFWELENDSNDRLFDILDIDEEEFCARYYPEGWENPGGLWPPLPIAGMDMDVVKYHMSAAMLGFQEHGCKVFLFDTKEQAKHVDVNKLDKFFKL